MRTIFTLLTILFFLPVHAEKALLTSLKGDCPKYNVSLKNSTFTCYPVHKAKAYQYRFIAQNDTIIYTRNNSGVALQLKFVDGLVENRSYAIQVRAYVSGKWGDFGPACSINSSSPPPSPVIAGNCPKTGLTFDSLLSAVPVENAGEYAYRFVNASGTLYHVGDENCTLSSVQDLAYNTSYLVGLRVKVNDLWSDWSPNCELNMGSVPLTKISGECPKKEVLLNNNFTASPVLGADDYQYLFVNGADNILYNSGSDDASLKLSSISGLALGKAYAVQVRARVGAQWGEFGAVCSFEMYPNIPTTYLTGACPKNFALPGGEYTCKFVDKAQDYQYIFVASDDTITYSRGYGNTLLQLASVAGFELGKSYETRVRAKVNGKWGPWGTACTINFASQPRSISLMPHSCGATNLSLDAVIDAAYADGSQDFEFIFVNENDTLRHVMGFNRRGLPLHLVNGIQQGMTYNVQVSVKVLNVWSSFGSVCTISTAAAALIDQSEDSGALFYLSASEETEKKGQLLVYPNPSKGALFLNLNDDVFFGAEVVLMDLFGKQVLRSQLLYEREQRLDLSTLSKGFYVLQIRQGEKLSYQERLLVQ